MAGTIVVERVERIHATPETLLPLIAHLPRWVEWSPWEDLDPEAKNEYTGEPGAVGSTYSWNGNRKAGEGMMRITAVDADSVALDLQFTRPFRSSNTLRFTLEPDDGATRVIWRMETPKTFLLRFFNLDKTVGRDFEKGLRQLKQLAEAH